MSTERDYTPHPVLDNNGVPLCTEHCPHHDGKRCQLLTIRPERICEPAVIDMARSLRAIAGTPGKES